MVMLFHLQHYSGSATFNKSGSLRELGSETVSTDAGSNYIAGEVAQFTRKLPGKMLSAN